MKYKGNILIITPSYIPAYTYGGPIYSIASLASELSKATNLLVLTTTANGNRELNVIRDTIQDVKGAQVIYFKSLVKGNVHLSLDLLVYLFRNGHKYDVIHIHSWWNLVAILSAIICVFRSWKFVVSPRGMLSHYTFSKSLTRKIFHYIIGDTVLKKSILHSTSDFEANNLKKINALYNIKTIPNLIYTEVPKIVKESSSIFKLLFLSRIHPKKGLDILINNLNRLPFEYSLTIVGEGEVEYIDKLKKIAKIQAVADKIIWKGSEYSDEKYNIYANSDILILPSYDENFANNIIEALLMGTPVIVSKNVALAEFVLKHNLGWTFNINEKHDLAHKINLAYNDLEKRMKINSTSKSIVLQEFNNNNIIQGYLSMYYNA